MSVGDCGWTRRSCRLGGSVWREPILSLALRRPDKLHLLIKYPAFVLDG